MSRISPLSLPCLLTAALTAACGAPDAGDKSGGDGAEDALYEPCTSRRVSLATGDLAPDGSDPAAALAVVGAAAAGTFTYASGGTTPFLLSPDPSAAALVWVDQEPNTEGGGGTDLAYAADCVDYLEITLPMGFGTDDGAFDFAGDMVLAVGLPLADEFARGSVTAPTTDFAGGYDWSVHSAAGTTSLEGELFLSFAADGAVLGAVSAATTGEDGDTAWAGREEIGSFSGAPVE